MTARQLRAMIRVTEDYGSRNVSYLKIDNGRVAYMGGGETPYALSNLFGCNAAIVRWELEQARDYLSAIRTLEKYAPTNSAGKIMVKFNAL